MASKGVPTGPLDWHPHWKDDGCEVAKRCTECPLLKCRYEYPAGLPQALKVLAADQRRETA